MSDRSLHHVGITVTDLERAVDFYTSVLGLEELARFSVDGEAFETAVDVDGAAGSFVHLDGDGVRVELVAYDPSGEDRSGGEIVDAGAKHLALESDDVRAFYESLPADVETLSEPQTTASGSTLFFLRDPDGTLVEIIEPAS